MPTVNEVARELGLTSNEVLDRLERIGRPAPSDTSPIDKSSVDALRADLGNGPVHAEAASEARRPPSEGAPPPPAKPTEPSSKKGAGDSGAKKLVRQLMELPLLVLVAFGIAVLIKTFLAQAFFIPSGSMKPTLRNGDRVLVEKLSYRFGDPERGQVVVFAKTVLPGPQPDLPWDEDLRNLIREVLGLPTGREEDYIKRIVAIGGDRITYEGRPRRLEVNGRTVPQPYLKRPDRFSPAVTPANCKGMHLLPAGDACRVPAGRVFVMGDNRNKSMDSRVFGAVEENMLVGRAFVIIWPLRDFAGL